MRRSILSFVIAISAAAPLAHAGFLGFEVRADSHAELGGVSLDSFDDATVGAGIEFPSFNAGPHSFDVDLGDDTIRITNFDAADTWDALDFNGLIFSDERNAIDRFASVAVLGTTTMAGLDASRVSIGDDDHLLLDWGGLSFAPSTVVELRVGFAATPPDASSVPAPTAVPAGVALTVSLLLRRRRAAA